MHQKNSTLGLSIVCLHNFYIEQVGFIENVASNFHITVSAKCNNLDWIGLAILQVFTVYLFRVVDPFPSTQSSGTRKGGAIGKPLTSGSTPR